MKDDPFEIDNLYYQGETVISTIRSIQKYMKTELAKGHSLPALANAPRKRFFSDLKVMVIRYWEEPVNFLLETNRAVQDLPNNDTYFASIGQNWCPIATDIQFKTESNLQSDREVIERIKSKAEKAHRWSDVWKIDQNFKFSPLFTNNYTPPTVKFNN